MELVYSFSKDYTGKYLALCESHQRYSVIGDNINKLVSRIIKSLKREYGKKIEFDEIEILQDDEYYRLKITFQNTNTLN